MFLLYYGRGLNVNAARICVVSSTAQVRFLELQLLRILTRNTWRCFNVVPDDGSGDNPPDRDPHVSLDDRMLFVQGICSCLNGQGRMALVCLPVTVSTGISAPYPDGPPARTARCTISGAERNPVKSASTLDGSKHT